QHRLMRRQLFVGRRVRPRWSRWAVRRTDHVDHLVDPGCREIEPRLTATEQLDIDIGQQPAIEFGTMLLARRQIDRKTPAQRVEARRGAWKTGPGDGERVVQRARVRRWIEPGELRIE